MREDIIKLDKLDQDVRFLGKNHVKTYAQLKEIRQKTSDELQQLSEERNALRSRLKKELRNDDQLAAEKTRVEISILSIKITELRQNIKICDRIEKRSIARAEAQGLYHAEKQEPSGKANEKEIKPRERQKEENSK